MREGALSQMDWTETIKSFGAYAGDENDRFELNIFFDLFTLAIVISACMYATPSFVRTILLRPRLICSIDNIRPVTFIYSKY